MTLIATFLLFFPLIQIRPPVAQAGLQLSILLPLLPQSWYSSVWWINNQQSPKENKQNPPQMDDTITFSNVQCLEPLIKPAIISATHLWVLSWESATKRSKWGFRIGRKASSKFLNIPYRNKEKLIQYWNSIILIIKFLISLHYSTRI